MRFFKQSETYNSAYSHLHPKEYRQEFHYYPLSVKLDRCVGICNAMINLSNKV